MRVPSFNAAFILTTPAPIVITCAPAQSLPACTSQADVQTAYDVWSTSFSFTGGCSAASNISSIPSLPADAFCSGANLSFTYSVTDACGSQSCTSSFSVQPAILLSLTCPPAQSLPPALRSKQSRLHMTPGERNFHFPVVAPPPLISPIFPHCLRMPISLELTCRLLT